jgi:hypothetical protein
MAYNTLVLDCDGTLLNSKGMIDPLTKETLINLQEAGNRLILASGRPALGMIDFVKELQLDKFDSHYISFNGAEIFSAKNNEKIYERYLELDEQEKVYDFILSKDLTILTYHHEDIILSGEGPHVHEESRMTGMNEIIAPTYFEKNENPHPKVMGVGDREIVEKYQKKYFDGFTEKTSVTTSQPYFIEFINSSVSKGAALKFLEDQFDFSLAHSIGVGDSHNDISLIEATAKGIGVHNAVDSLKEVADEVTQSNDELGVVEVVNKYFLN